MGIFFYLIFRYEGAFIGVIRPVSLSYITYSYVFLLSGKKLRDAVFSRLLKGSQAAM